MKLTKGNFFLLGFFRPYIADKLLSSEPKKRREKTPEDQAKHLLSRFSYEDAVRAAKCVQKRSTNPDTIRFWERTVVCIHSANR